MKRSRKLSGIRRGSGYSVAELARKLSLSRDEIIEIENDNRLDWAEAFLLAVGADQHK